MGYILIQFITEILLMFLLFFLFRNKDNKNKTIDLIKKIVISLFLFMLFCTVYAVILSIILTIIIGSLTGADSGAWILVMVISFLLAPIFSIATLILLIKRKKIFK